MHPWHAALLGIVEGLTEYLPVSSTGHLILTGHLLGIDSAPAHAFEIVIQLGAILAVVAHYRGLLRQRLAGLVTRDPASVSLALALVVAFVPTAVAGLLLRKAIKRLLFGPGPVAVALVAGGVVMLAWALLRTRRPPATPAASGLEHVTLPRALAIGAGQCLALWPGMSRSMCTILAGELAGLSTTTAAEFSFLLALPTLGAATMYELLKSWSDLAASFSVATVATGLVVSFVVAWGVIAAFLRYLARYGLAPFGVYRVVAGVIVFAVLAR